MQEAQNDLGESDEDPPAPWVEEEKAKKKQAATRKEEEHIEAVMARTNRPAVAETPVQQMALEAPVQQMAPEAQDDDDSHGDLGESDDVGVQSATTEANAMTEKAQARVRAEDKLTEKAAAIERAKAIANKVRKLVQHQQHLEKVSGQKVEGSVLGEAMDNRARAIEAKAHDQLLAQKLQDQQAQHTMEHLLDEERTTQHAAFKKERTDTNNLLKTVKDKLKMTQQKILGEVKAETTTAMKKVESELSNTAIAKTIEDVVKKKLSKRVAELQATGEKAVHDVAAQMQTLKSTVRRLRRKQSRMEVEEAKMSRESHSDLGESAGMGYSNPAMEMQKMRMEMEQQNQQQMMMMHQQQMMQQQPMQQQPMMQPPQQQQQQQPMMQQQQQQPMMQQPVANTAEHAELMQMREQMLQMKQQNEHLQQMMQQQMNTRRNAVMPQKPNYTHQGLAKYFKNKRFNAAMLKKDVLEEERRMKDSRGQHLDTMSMLEVSESKDGIDMETISAVPLYNKRAEEARIASENLVQRAQRAAMETERKKA